jgi:ribulose-phosphate 3-epimerase
VLKCSTSLWNADLANMAAEIKRIEPFSESFHIDVADGHFVPPLLFFPDFVRDMRKHTSLPFDVHLIVDEPLKWVEPFAEAGADWITFFLNAGSDPVEVIQAIKGFGKKVGLTMQVGDSLDIFDPYWDDMDFLTIMGTKIGIRGAGNDPTTTDRIRKARQFIDQHGLKTQILADGGIRRETVPGLYAAGAHYIIPGSLMFKEDPVEMRKWLASLDK